MVTIHDTELKEGFLEAIKRANKLSTPVLVSEVQKIEFLEPLSFFRAGKESFYGDRFFWKDPSEQTVIIGLGISKQFQSDQATDRFFHVENEWKRFKQEAIIIDPYSKVATGPVMFGGFSFDPLKEKTSLWSKFPHSLFNVPKYLLSVTDGEVFLTTNIVCTQHYDPSLVEKLISERQALLSNTLAPVDLPKVVSQKEVNAEDWKETVQSLVNDLKLGELKKAVLARELRLVFEDKVNPEAVISNLLQQQEDSFIFAFESQGDCFIGASPERLVKKQNNHLFSTCLAGSIGRGETEEEDQRLGQALLTDEKNLVEHQYVVEMIKASMEKVCEEVSLPDMPDLLKMRDIQHLYTPVIGKSNSSSSLLQLVNLLHPTPALGGLPKEQAVEKIRKIEDLDRGYYAAPLGWMDHNGNGEFAVAIRSGLIQGLEASLFAGCGIVQDSNVESEYLETKIKFRPMLSALGGINK